MTNNLLRDKLEMMVWNLLEIQTTPLDTKNELKKWLEGGEKVNFCWLLYATLIAERRCNTPEVPMWRIIATTRRKDKRSECPEWGLGDCIAP